jgi:hypothetical protein
MRLARIAPTRYRAEPDAADADQQTVLLWYPVVTAGASPYIRSAVKIEVSRRGPPVAAQWRAETSTRTRADGIAP